MILRIFLLRYQCLLFKKGMADLDIIFTTIYSNNKLGVTAPFIELLAKNNAIILDINQTSTHNSLSLEILFSAHKDECKDVLYNLSSKADNIDACIKFVPINKKESNNWLDNKNKNRYIITLLGKKLTAKQIVSVTNLIDKQGIKVDNIVRLTDTTALDTNRDKNNSSIELHISGSNINKKEIQKKLIKLSAKHNIDISFQQNNIFRAMRRVICFDMDSTLIQTEVIDELAIRAGMGNKVKKITELAMQGKIDFEESFKQRVKLLKNLNVSVMEEIAKNLPVTEGLERLMSILKKLGYKTAILSGGFTYFANHLKDKYQFDYVYANNLEIKDGHLTGNYIDPIIDAKKKAELLKQIAQNEKIDIRQTIAVGDGANDLLMLEAAGLGIAYNAKPKVIEAAETSLSNVGIDGILYFLGYKDSMLNNQL